VGSKAYSIREVPRIGACDWTLMLNVLVLFFIPPEAIGLRLDVTLLSIPLIGREGEPLRKSEGDSSVLRYSSSVFRIWSSILLVSNMSFLFSSIL
jgi:hypothetical protein